MAKTNSKKTANIEANKPTLQFSVLCDGVAKAQNNKPVFIGVFSNLIRTGVIPQFCIVNRWVYGTGTFKQKVVIKEPNLKNTVAEVAEQEFTLETEVSSADLISGFINVNFDKKGVYWIEVYLDNELIMSYPLPVYEQTN